ncbi:hypothetical protein U9M48_022090 [Paspalum notatum var. saurae]|uniref:Uncharacterized protein n=1 Tax=Paspalum notatum var. saurae TaxID=547442 RepID=A0AAQ3WTN8_PASNO
MHIDSANEGPTRSDHEPKVAGRRARAPGAEDGVSPIKPSPFQGVAQGQSLTTRQTNGAYQIMIKDAYGGLEVILDVYFPLHVTSL